MRSCRSASSGSNSVSCSTESMFTSPRCFDLSRNLSRVSGGCMGSYVSVASLPPHLSMIFLPPGCSSLKSVTSYALPCIMTLQPCSTMQNAPVYELGKYQQSLSLLCFATSSPLHFCSLGSLFSSSIFMLYRITVNHQTNYENYISRVYFLSREDI